MSLHELAESHLKTMLEDLTHWGMPVELIGPDGKEYKTSANSPDPSNPEPLCGQVRYTTIRVNPATGEPVVTGFPAVALRISSLERVPQQGERWSIRFPTEPKLTAALKDYVLSANRASDKRSTLGILVMHPTKADQSS